MHLRLLIPYRYILVRFAEMLVLFNQGCESGSIGIC
jgi:hypothetical protein